MSDNMDSSPYDKGENPQPVPVPQETASEPIQEIPERKDLVLTYISINFLKEVAKWTKFISIVGFVMVGLMVFGGLAFGSLMATIGSVFPSEFSSNSDNPAALGAVFGFMYLFIAALYFFPVYYLYNFSSKLKTAIQLNSEVLLESSFKNLKSHYKFMGIILIIFLVIYGGTFLLFGVGTIFASMF